MFWIFSLKKFGISTKDIEYLTKTKCEEIWQCILRLHFVGILPLTINYKFIVKDNDKVNKEKFSIFFICTNLRVFFFFFSSLFYFFFFFICKNLRFFFFFFPISYILSFTLMFYLTYAHTYVNWITHLQYLH